MAVARIETPELLDEPGLSGPEAGRSLAHVAWATTGLGGVGAVVGALRRIARGRRRLRVLDVGAGNGEVARVLADRLARSGITSEWTLLDVAPGALASAANPGVDCVAGDARRLPFRNGTFDAALSVLTLHHFGPDDAVRVLREMGRVSRLGVVTSDLRRCRPGLLGAHLLARTIWRRNRLTRNDAPLSVRRSYTATEVQDLAHRAGLAGPAVRHHFPFRLLLLEHRDHTGVTQS